MDGVDCSVLGVRDLRSRMAIIPQEPFLFKGTVRFNLDPTGAHSDVDLWQSLEAAELKVRTSSSGVAELPPSPTNLPPERCRLVRRRRPAWTLCRKRCSDCMASWRL